MVVRYMDSVDNDLDIITNLLAPYEEYHMEQFESNIADCKKNPTASTENQKSSINWL